MQNTAARIVTLKMKRERIKPVLKYLHRLPVNNCIDQQILSLTNNCFNATVPQYLQELIPRYEPPRSLRSSRIPKSSSALGLSQTLPKDSRMPFLRRLENLSLLQLFAGNSRLTRFQTSDCTIIHLFVFFPVFFFFLHCLSFGRETVPVCATKMNFPWVFVS